MKPDENIAEDIWSVPSCSKCGSELIVKDATVCWNQAAGLWELEQMADQAHCQRCGATELNWSKPELSSYQRIRDLNDQFRTTGTGRGSIMITSSIQANGAAFSATALKAIRDFKGFTDDNDPWGEHDFGAVEIEGEKVFFKIDYFDLSLQQGSPNPANEGCTHRVMTIMLASEF